MAALIVLVIVIGCAAFQYFKGSVLKAFVMLMTAICSGLAAFACFEPLAALLISRETLPLWAQSLCFLLVFVLTFAVLQTIAEFLTRQSVDLGDVPEKAGRVALGLLTGLIVSGILLTALALAPVGNNIPYQRFDDKLTNIDAPKKSLLNTDGLTAGLFAVISRGTLSGKTSFAALHADFLDQLFLNRHPGPDKVPLITAADALEIPKKAAVWPAPDGLTDQNGKAAPSMAAHNLTIIRIGFSSKTLQQTAPFTLSQLRAVCKPDNDKNPLRGKGLIVYPLGYLSGPTRIHTARPDETIKLTVADTKHGTRWIDFALLVPTGFKPVLVEFKANAIARLPSAVTAGQAPAPEPFISFSNCTGTLAEIKPAKSAKIYGTELAAGEKFLSGLNLPIADENDWKNAQSPQSAMPAQFDENGNIVCVKASLKTSIAADKAADKTTKKADRESEDKGNLPAMLKPADGYKLLSLKCNNPDTGSPVSGSRLPALQDIADGLHSPVGIVASAPSDDTTIHQIEFCSLTTGAGLRTDDTGRVTASFVETVWLTGQAQKISQFYLIYMVKSGTIITSVNPYNMRTGAGFVNVAGFAVN